MMDRRAMERGLADVGRILEQAQLDSIDEANDYLQEILAGGQLPHLEPSSEVERAQDVMYDAWMARGPKRVARALGRRQEAIEHYADLLRLNPGDNQGVRYILLKALLETGDQERVKALLDSYPEDIAAVWMYGVALVAFREQGDTRSTRAALTK